MTRMAWSSIGAATLALMMGCGPSVVVDPNGTTTTGGTAGGGTGGSGGAAPAKVCGGKQGLQCGPDEWCQWDPPGTCGGFDNTGICQPKPTSCNDEPCGFVPMCGCDGNPYCNPCEAHMAGVDVHEGTDACFNAPTDPEYAAYALPTDAPRYLITKTEHALDRCVVIFMVGWQTGQTNIDVTANWGVERIFITPHASDCALGAGLWPPPPEEVKTDIAKGSIKQDSTTWPCFVSIDVAVAWPPGSPSWVPADETLQTSNLMIQGGGCGG